MTVALNITNKIIKFPSTSNNNSKHKSSYVDPIKNLNDIERAKQFFYETPLRYKSLNIRNYALFVTGINIARRISDILDLKVSDVLNLDRTFKDEISIKEHKTGKYAHFPLNSHVREALSEYFDSRKDFKLPEPLFISRKGGKLTRQQAWRIMKDMGHELDLNCNIGTHTLRKTWAYQQVKRNPNNLVLVSEAFNHSSERITRKYIGLDKETMFEFYNSNPL